MPNMFKKLEEAEKLPIGHVGRREAEQTIYNTYRMCHSIERFWNKRFDYRLLEPKEARQIADGLCSMLGQAPVKKIIFESSEVGFVMGWLGLGNGAFYQNGRIHIKYWNCSIPLLVHELCHHFGENGHGEQFCEMLVFLFEVTFEMLKGKRPNADWHDKCLKKAKNGA